MVLEEVKLEELNQIFDENSKKVLNFNIENKTSSTNLRNIFGDNEKFKDYCEKEIKKYKEFFNNLKN